jgi:peptidoglycan/xylan/chitin deacetylase (PgdA/CDA1 family)
MAPVTSPTNSSDSRAPTTTRVWQRIAAATTSATKRRLRVLAYHSIDEPDAFARQVTHLRHQYEPVSARAVIAAMHGTTTLPDRAVWVTFDDGFPSVVEHGLPALSDAGVPATMFVCPGLIDAGSPNWWDVVDTATTHGLGSSITNLPTSAAPVTHLKTLPDLERRRIVDALAGELAERGISVPQRQLTIGELTRWEAAGNDLGNHSWDHPCLDRCEPAEQRRQVTDADAWLRRRRPDGPRIFAYPNGNATPTVEAVLGELGYDLALLFDHRLASTTGHPYRVSRLRVSSSASDARFAAILSGAHSAGYRLKRAMTPTKHPDTALRPPAG